jgi:ribosome biogenesis GTPase / thiamine phosphate phosphatase
MHNSRNSTIKLPDKWQLRPQVEQPLIGDWLVVDQAGQPIRILGRISSLSKRSSGHGQHAQYMAANIDTMFVVSSCNQDFNSTLAISGNGSKLI